MAESANAFSLNENRPFAREFYAVIVVLLFVAFAFQLWYHSVRTSATIDEGAHILAGHRHWQCADFGINPSFQFALSTMPGSQPKLIPGQTYYINIRNRDLSGGPVTCSHPECNLRITVNAPQ